VHGITLHANHKAGTTGEIMHHCGMPSVVLVLVIFAICTSSFSVYCLPACCAPNAAQSTNSNDYFYDGLIFKSKRQVKQAAESFRQAQKQRPNDPEPFANEALMQLRLGNFKEVERLSRKAIAMDKSYEQPLQYLANTLIHQNKLVEGIAVCKKCLALNPENDWCLQNMRLSQRKLNLPITDIYEGKFSEDRQAVMQVAKDLQDQKYDNALKITNRHIARYPTHYSGYLKRAYVYEGMHRRDLAIKDYDKLLSMYPCELNALDLRAQAYQANKQAGKAVKDLIKLARDVPDRWSIRSRLAFAQMEAGDYKSAKREYTGLLRVYPNSIEVLSGRAETHFRAQEYKEALADYTQAIVSHPSRSAGMYYKRGLVYEKMGDKKKAAEDIAIARKMGYDPKEF